MTGTLHVQVPSLKGGNRQDLDNAQKNEHEILFLKKFCRRLSYQIIRYVSTRCLPL